MNRSFWFRLLLVLAVYVASQGGTYLVLSLIGIEGQEYTKIFINITLLIVCVGLVRRLNLSA